MVAVLSCFGLKTSDSGYTDLYTHAVTDFDRQQHILLDQIDKTKQFSETEIHELKAAIKTARLKLKDIDFWLRYLEPVAYKKINGPLPVEWENEVFEKFEKPYKRIGGGLTLVEQYLDTKHIRKDSLSYLIQLSIDAINTFRADSITQQLQTPDHFFFCNRFFLLNLASIYTTGFECPDRTSVIPELKSMLQGVKNIYLNFEQSFPATPIAKEYLELYTKMIAFVNSQSLLFDQFDHFTFIKDYVNPLFAINQQMIVRYKVISKNFNDYSLNNTPQSIFDKGLYTAQNTKGVYSLVEDEQTLAAIKATGKLLFYDPILSGNNARSCASCHKPTSYFTDTSFATSMQFNNKDRLPRNTPTLINVVYNHLVMLDGKHTSLHAQANDVMTNPNEMGGEVKDLLEKILSCKEYKTAFRKFLKVLPGEKEITMDQVISAITSYYGDFSNYYAPFDEAMNHNKPLDQDAIKGFNLFMGKAQCATCHFVPGFNGVPAPFISSEFEVAGTPADIAYSKLSEDKGRYLINPAFETMGAFRTSTIRNTAYTKPYMHNGVFNTLEQVIDFYDLGGGAGRKLAVANQTLSSDSLKLTSTEKKELIRFIYSLNENITFDTAPTHLPVSSNKILNQRVVGGVY